MEEESIYNLIPKEYIPPAKEQIYHSKYPKKLPPTGSTFNNKTTSRPKATNLNGDFELPKGPHSHVGKSSTLGKLKGFLNVLCKLGEIKPKTSEYRKKNTGTMGSNKLPESTVVFRYSDENKKPTIPKSEEKPIMGLRTNKNYIIANAVENILSAPKLKEDPVRYVNKNEYGKVPEYLQTIKQRIESEYDMIKEMQLQEAEEQEKMKYPMSKEEIKQLKDGLTKKWEAVNKEYQQITHLNKITTIGIKRKLLLSFKFLEKKIVKENLHN